MELATPITIYWDLPPGPADTEWISGISAAIADCRPLMLKLTIPCREGVDGGRLVLDLLRGTPISLSVTLPIDAVDLADSVAGAHELLVGVPKLPALASPAVRVFFSSGKGEIQVRGISFPVDRDTWTQLPPLIALCRAQGIRRLVLPMQRLYRGESPFFITRAEQQELAASFVVVGGTDGMDLTIHDPFLWRAFHPGVPFPQGGCQAANTMVAIASDGGVYPCPTLPVRLGDAGAVPLRDIIASSGKKELRRLLLDYPGQCLGCGEIGECRGGCRGRGLALSGTLDGIDTACR